MAPAQMCATVCPGHTSGGETTEANGKSPFHREFDSITMQVIYVKPQLSNLLESQSIAASAKSHPR